MNKFISILLLGTLSAFAYGADKTPGGQQHEHADAQQEQAEQHGHADAMPHEETAQQHEHAEEESHEQSAQQHEHAEAAPHGHDDGASEDHHAGVAGRPGDSANVTRTVKITMGDDMRFTPSDFSVDAGETIRIAMHNEGQIDHEFVIGSMDELLEHAEMMRAMPTMQHAESNMLTLATGADGEIVWYFDQAGTVDFACLIPGHLEAGMKGSITVN